MQDLSRQFLDSSIESLKHINTVLQTEDEISESFLRQLYRQIHTLKGTAQVFGLTKQAKLAHELENILASAEKKYGNEKSFRETLREGLNLLLYSLEDTNFDIPQSFIEKTQKIALNDGEIRGVFLSLIPPEVFDQLTEFEKNKIAAALKDNKNLYRLDTIFNIASFSDELRNMQELLKEKGEIIFTMPGETPDSHNKIAFQIFLSGLETAENLQADLKDYDAKVVLLTSRSAKSKDLAGVLSQIALQGKNWAAEMGKEAKVFILSDEPDLSPGLLKMIFDILLHLVKNSIDHSIEKKGKIEIRIREENGGLQLIVSDDGAGVNLEKVREKAIKRDLISEDTFLSEQELLEFLFLPGFSTSEKITEISGRGIGLDAARDMIINTGGTIGIESQKGVGTRFEIFLPIK